MYTSISKPLEGRILALRNIQFPSKAKNWNIFNVTNIFTLVNFSGEILKYSQENLLSKHQRVRESLSAEYMSLNQ